MAIKTLAVKYWHHKCSFCSEKFDVEEKTARMAPDVQLVVSDSEGPFSVLDRRKGVICPFCKKSELVRLGKGVNKKVELTLLVHPQWLAGTAKVNEDGIPFGGTAMDDVISSSLWNQERGRNIRLIEVRGKLPDTITCPDTRLIIKTGKDGGTVPKRSHFECRSCGNVQDVMTSVKATSNTAPIPGAAQLCRSALLLSVPFRFIIPGPPPTEKKPAS